jgi:hypothetical protein
MLKGYGERTFGQIAMDSDEIVDSLIPGDIADNTMWIYNLSTESDLRVRLSTTDSWLSCDDNLHYIGPEDSLAFVITINSTGMDPGDYAGMISCVSNDFTQPYDTISVLLHLYAPQIDIPTTMITETVEAGSQKDQDLVVYNIGPGRLEYSITCQMFDGLKNDVVAKPLTPRTPIGTRPADKGKSEAQEPYYAPIDRGAGGPDVYGYSWIDSDDPSGPTYEWVDIAGVGTPIALGDDDSLGPIALGFDFPFYENFYNEVFICSNGMLTFGDGSDKRVNTSLPAVTEPNNMIAMWWDDLDPPEGGNVYHHYDATNDRFIVSFVDIRNYLSPDGTGSLTFQAILYPNGRIVLQYGTMDPGSDSDGLTGATLGLENHLGSDGLDVVYNAAYLHDNMAISFKAARWMTVTPAAGTIEPFESATLTVSFDAAELENGDYIGQISVACNDPIMETWVVPVMLKVESFMCGDANGDDEISVGDVVFIINNVFKGGPSPDPIEAGDANGDGEVNTGDAIYLINNVFKGGPAPICP